MLLLLLLPLPLPALNTCHGALGQQPVDVLRFCGQVRIYMETGRTSHVGHGVGHSSAPQRKGEHSNWVNERWSIEKWNIGGGIMSRVLKVVPQHYIGSSSSTHKPAVCPKPCKLATIIYRGDSSASLEQHPCSAYAPDLL
jgi:hypothetical protein